MYLLQCYTDNFVPSVNKRITQKVKTMTTTLTKNKISKTYGRFNTRKELVEKVFFFSRYSSLNEVEIAQGCQVSPNIIKTILKEHKISISGI